MKRVILPLILCFTIYHSSKAQTSLSETFGQWSDGSSWVGGTAPATNAANIQNVNIDGFIRRDGNITSTSNFGLTVNTGDTLVINGDLTIQNGNVAVNNESVLLITGDVSGSNFSLNLNAGGSVIFAGAETSISGITTNGGGNLYVFDTTPSISGNANGSNGIETEADLSNDAPDLFDFVNKGGVLPVELISFSSTVGKNTIEVNWATASEINNDYFEVQKSADGINYSRIAKVEGHGNSTRLLTYSFTDKSPLGGINYYRLKQVDFDGSFELSKITSSFFDAPNGSMNIFPNPANNYININLDNRFINTKTDIYIFNLNGELINQPIELLTPTSQINLSLELTDGAYILRLSNALFTENMKLIVE